MISKHESYLYWCDLLIYTVSCNMFTCYVILACEYAEYSFFFFFIFFLGLIFRELVYCFFFLNDKENCTMLYFLPSNMSHMGYWLIDIMAAQCYFTKLKVVQECVVK